jgi:1-acyl-sn-glycerol-3-phosphate acyltransferase
MFTRLRARHPCDSIPRILFYEICRLSARAVLWLICRPSGRGLENIPQKGSLLIAANHQSYLDPPTIGGLISIRQLDFIARSGLFAFGPFARLITWLNSIPVRGDASDSATIKEVIRRIESGHAVLIFPEGSRTPDGAMHRFKRGIALLVKRAKCPVLPVAIEGAYDNWPRRRKAPRFFGNRVLVKYGAPIPYDELMKDGVDAALTRLALEIDRMRLELRVELRQMTADRVPKRGPGDAPFDPATATVTD